MCFPHARQLTYVIYNVYKHLQFWYYVHITDKQIEA